MSQNTPPLQAEVDRLKLEVQTLKVKHGVENISVGNYLLNRLAQLGVTVRFAPVIKCFADPYHIVDIASACLESQETSIWAS